MYDKIFQIMVFLIYPLAAQKIDETTFQSIIQPISRSTLVSTVNGTIYDNGRNYGEIVKKGTPIIRINSTEAKDELMTQVVNYIATKDTYRTNKFSVQKNIELEKKGIISKREVEESVSILTRLMEPAVIFVVAAIVGTIVISLYLPMFSLLEKI